MKGLALFARGETKVWDVGGSLGTRDSHKKYGCIEIHTFRGPSLKVMHHEGTTLRASPSYGLLYPRAHGSTHGPHTLYHRTRYPSAPKRLASSVGATRDAVGGWRVHFVHIAGWGRKRGGGLGDAGVSRDVETSTGVPGGPRLRAKRRC